jgi:hypothetical protein
MSFEKLIEEKIRAAREAGQFDNLRGTGQPFAYVDDERQPDWLGLHVLRENGFLPEWLELRKQIAAERDDVAAALVAWGDEIIMTGSPTHPLATRAGERYRASARAINAKIDLHNLRCPSLHFEIARFREDAQPVEAIVVTQR